MGLCIFSCLRGRNCERSCDKSSDCGFGPAAADVEAPFRKVLDQLQAALLRLNGSCLSRMDGFLQFLQVHGMNAEIYGVHMMGESRTPEMVLLSPTCHLGWLDAEADLTSQASLARVPIKHNVGCISGGSPSRHQPRGDQDLGVRHAAAVPLFHGTSLVGVLLIADTSDDLPLKRSLRQEASGSNSETLTQHAILQKSHESRPTAAITGGVLREPPHPVLSREILRSDEALRQLSFSVSMCLAGNGSDSLTWLTETVSRLRAAPSMQALTAQLCVSLAAHVRSRFVLDLTVSAALVPPPAPLQSPGPLSIVGGGAKQLATTALLFRSAGGPGSGAAGDGGGVYNSALGESEASCSVPMADSLGCDGALRRGGGGPSCTAGAVSPTAPVIKFSRSSSSLLPLPRQLTLQLRSSQAAPVGESSLSISKILDMISGFLSSEALTATPAAAGFGGGSGGLGSGGGILGGSSGVRMGHLVVPLNPKAAASFTSAATPLQVTTFQLKSTLLHAALLQQQQQSQWHVGATVDTPVIEADAARSVGAKVARKGMEILPVVEDTLLYIQDVHKPSRDVYMLLAAATGVVTSPPVSGAIYGRGSAAAGTNSDATNSDNVGRKLHFLPKSLALLTMPLAEEGAALGLYLCFPKHLPGALLEAVRASCQELVDKALKHQIREQLAGPLAPEYDTLKMAVPGSYAVLRGVFPDKDYSGQGGGGDGGTFSRTFGRMILDSAMGRLHTLDGALKHHLSTTDLEDLPPPQSHQPQARDWQKGSIIQRGIQGNSFKRGRVYSITKDGIATVTAPAATSSTVRPSHLSATTGTAAAAAAAAMITAAAVGDSLDLLASCNGDIQSTVSSYGVGSAANATGASFIATADLNHASIIMVEGSEPALESARHQIDLLLQSVHASMQSIVATTANTSCAFEGDLDQLRLVEVLGQGGGGVVLKGLMSGTLPVAVKLMDFPDDDVSRGTGAGGNRGLNELDVRRELRRTATELAVQSALSHPNIVQYYATFTDVILRSRRDGSAGVLSSSPASMYLQVVPSWSPLRDDGARVTCIIAEFCDGGSLASALCNRMFPRLACMDISKADALSHSMYDMKGVYMTLLDVALALRHLHSMHLVHRDVKPANLLLKSNPRDPRGFTVKLADFGFVLQLTEMAADGNRYAGVDEVVGTVTHMAPECVRSGSKITTAADVYSFGILMWELIAGGSRPFPSVHPDKILQTVQRGVRPVFTGDIPESYRNLAKLCWCARPEERPRASELVIAVTALLNCCQ